MNVLFINTYRSFQWIDDFREALKAEGVRGKIFVAQENLGLPEGREGIRFFRLKKNWKPSAILEICRDYKIDLVIPSNESGLFQLAFAKSHLQEHGTTLLCPSPSAVQIARDKLKTAQYFNSLGLRTPQTLDSALAGKKWKFPVFIKPRVGIASRGCFVAHSRSELDFYLGKIPGAMVQQLVKGTEFTVEVLIDLGGRVVQVVPRRSFERLFGNDLRAVIFRDSKLESMCKRIAEGLPEVSGLICIEGFRTPRGEYIFTEINPRHSFAGFLANRAGPSLARQIVRMLLGRPLLKGKIRAGAAMAMTMEYVT